MEITLLDVSGRAPNRLLEDLSEELGESPTGVTLKLEPREDPLRDLAIDQSILVAVLTGASSALATLVVGLLRLVERRTPTGTIVIEGRSGVRLEVPAGTPHSEIETLIDQARALAIDRIELH